ncbi:MAG: N-acetyl-gamma-glutamyl-phosphate reductase [Burkholderiales bacterium]|jgi:N-acetyl-gamma-glutamyl-phosphate reductase
MTTPRVFIDGEHGTTGLLIRDLLLDRGGVEVVSIAPEKRKDAIERKLLLNAVDMAVLCLPDDAARESVAMIENGNTKVLDASTAHRVLPDWTFGFPEMDKGQAQRIRQSRRVANPGCWSTCFIALVRPLVEAELLPADFPISTWGVSGYSGGGRQMIEQFEAPDNQTRFIDYGLKLNHKHLPEMTRYAMLKRAPLFTPSVGSFKQGMLLQVPLNLWSLPNRVAGPTLRDALANHFAGSKFVDVKPYSAEPPAELNPEALNHTNQLELFVFDNPKAEQAILVARLDNLGKGAGRAAMQNIELMLDLN